MKSSSHGASRSTQVAGAALALSVFASIMGCGDDGPSSSARPLGAEPLDDRAGADASPSGGPLPSPVLDPSGDISGRGESAAGADFIAADSPAGVPGAPSLLSPDQACAARVVEAETIERVVEVPIDEEVVVPSVFYLMLDSSGSMVQDPFSLASVIEQILDLFGLGQNPPAPTKWDFAIAGLKSFVNDPASAGLELGVGYFPEGGLCDGSGYDIPSVPLGVLPANAASIEASLDARIPSGGTPLEGALRGATGFCLAFNAEHPDASCVAVLITDGAAEECDARSATELALIAQSAADRGVLTYAAGMEGADFAVLDAIGAAGGGDCDPAAPGFACDLTANSNAFVAALNGIRDRTRTQTRTETRIEREVQALPCAWEIPSPPPGEAFDPGRVNVELGGPGAAPMAVANVSLASDCGAAGGWFYDDALAPTLINACPATCALLQAQPETRVDLLFGCATVIR
jgi:hypothetical protein